MARMYLSCYIVAAIAVVLVSLSLKCYLEIAQAPASPYPVTVEELPSDLIEWERRGFYKEIYGYNIFSIYMNASIGNDTILMIHGYPSSSVEYAYGAAESLVRMGYNVLAHDHVGFGFSDKPATGFGYSVQDHADVTLALWREMGVSGNCIIVSHDMGDSILTEILSRSVRNPDIFPSQMRVKQIVFTNGGMSLRGVNLRLSQRILMSSMGEWFNKFTLTVDKNNFFFKQQLLTVFSSHIRSASPDSVTGRTRDHQVKSMLAQLQYKGGMSLLWKTIRYIHDRYACQDRWLSSLRHLDIPIRFVWGAADAVAPRVIPDQVVEEAHLHVKMKSGQVKLQYMEGTGHFLMMEDGRGDEWARRVALGLP